jgi:hypothetical protein
LIDELLEDFILRREASSQRSLGDGELAANRRRRGVAAQNELVHGAFETLAECHRAACLRLPDRLFEVLAALRIGLASMAAARRTPEKSASNLTSLQNNPR